MAEWTDCDMVLFIDGRGYSIDDKGNTIDIGRKEHILNTFATGEIAKDLCPDRATVLQQVLDYREEQGIGQQPEPIKLRSFIRSRLAGDIKHRKENPKRSPSPKRLPIRKT